MTFCLYFYYLFLSSVWGFQLILVFLKLWGTSLGYLWLLWYFLKIRTDSFKLSSSICLCLLPIADRLHFYFIWICENLIYEYCIIDITSLCLSSLKFFLCPSHSFSTSWSFIVCCCYTLHLFTYKFKNTICWVHLRLFICIFALNLY